MDEPKVVAGLHCFDVLEFLDDYVGGDLAADVVTRVNEHLAECGACASFGGRYAELVRTLHTELGETADDADDVAQRVLRARSR